MLNRKEYGEIASNIMLSFKRRVQNYIHSQGQMMFIKCHEVRASIYDPTHEYEPIVREIQHYWVGSVLIYFE